jgi:hypothetical protein
VAGVDRRRRGRGRDQLQRRKARAGLWQRAYVRARAPKSADRALGAFDAFLSGPARRRAAAHSSVPISSGVGMNVPMQPRSRAPFLERAALAEENASP